MERFRDIEFVGEIEWDGKALLIQAATEFGHVPCRIPRETIHALSLYSDAIEREIRLERHLILERLAPALRAKISTLTAGKPVELWPWEVNGTRPQAVAIAPAIALELPMQDDTEKQQPS
ncbi:hypothetical protein XI09_05125 [Bradyrhizobium sp. CCBAU 11386]|uniref:hypothetical protein n=1 Tax=Bradyrhizobium sp. CCBAU 11386 TaxID=1630837 RepID=UPI002304B371|nr:hypothetical protein [Bradyrhizobium sp. CCBAU 11386]MDA9504157.1 hypothetical protein [Bradyrhizobium sp. CCBAU 11386]